MFTKFRENLSVDSNVRIEHKYEMFSGVGTVCGEMVCRRFGDAAYSAFREK
jgi:hypothetical protein